ncbi:MAG: hypothetical protein IPK82_27960 [Polyangiaceae bacterium]|nr:hypothetical protein [Polyangiaceae bacterium]
MPTIRVRYSDDQEHQIVDRKPYSCPLCGVHGPARVEVSWIARRAFGMVVRCAQIESRWTCYACGRWTQRASGVDEAPPALHRFGPVLFLGLFLGVPFLLLFAWGAVSYIGSAPQREQAAQNEDKIADLRTRAAELVQRGKTREADCKQKVEAAIALALPGGLAAGKPQKTKDLTVDQIRQLPTYPPGIPRLSWGWEDAPIGCWIDVSSEARVAVEKGLEFEHDPAKAAKSIEEYAKAVEALTVPTQFATLNDDAIAVVSSDGRLVAFATKHIDGLVAPTRR